jgi:arachidonate 15-lipoxygenase
VDALKSVYPNPEQVDLMIGLYAEERPQGFAISETAFRVFLLMAARRLKADRFFTYDYRPEVYTPEGIEWVETNTLATVLARHYPRLRTELEGVENAFKPWGAAASRRVIGRWHRRRRIWNAVSRTLFSSTKPLPVPSPDDRETVDEVAFAKKFPTIPIRGLAVADHFPENELKRGVLGVVLLEEWAARKFPPAQEGLPSIDRDPNRALVDAYPASYRRRYRAPARPLEYREDIDLGGLALASPYACYLRHNSKTDRLEWDLTALDRFELQRGLCSPGVRVEFELHAGRLDATRIDCELGSCTASDRDWLAAQRLAMCALATHVTLVRHFNWIHLVAGERLALVSHRFLPVKHPVRRLLQPHVYATHFGNRIVTPIQLQPGGDFERLFSYTHRGLCSLFEATIGEFDLHSMDPERDAMERGIDGLQSGALENRRELMEVIRRHTDRYLQLYFDDGEMRHDERMGAWIDELAVHLGGVKELAGSPLTVNGVSTVIAAFIYMVSVDHEIVDSGVWDYYLWSDVQAPRVYRDGRRLPVDVYQRLVNANFILNVDRTRLMSDFSNLAGDDRPGRQAFIDFRLDLEDLQRRTDRLKPELWRIEPRNLKANMNY